MEKLVVVKSDLALGAAAAAEMAARRAKKAERTQLKLRGQRRLPDYGGQKDAKNKHRG